MGTGFLLPTKVNVLGAGGFVSALNQLLSILVAFYIASLAAVSSFSSSYLDKKIAGLPIRLNVIHQRKKNVIELTRRMFLSTMFGYLAFISIFIYVLGVLAIQLGADIAVLLEDYIAINTSRFIFVTAYTLLCTNLLFTTLLGLHYMSDRIHRP
ncbi:MAG: hypothetical protein COC24_003515 [Alphaproteobacteria bacterium]|nr:hypothetical protein [Alphaproteobacteria bacterium]